MRSIARISRAASAEFQAGWAHWQKVQAGSDTMNEEAVTSCIRRISHPQSDERGISEDNETDDACLATTDDTDFTDKMNLSFGFRLP